MYKFKEHCEIIITESKGYVLKHFLLYVKTLFIVENSDRKYIKPIVSDPKCKAQSDYLIFY